MLQDKNPCNALDKSDRKKFDEMTFEVPRLDFTSPSLLSYAVQPIRLSIQYFYVNSALLLQATEQLHFTS
jgi:hypothetical protein